LDSLFTSSAFAAYPIDKQAAASASTVFLKLTFITQVLSFQFNVFSKWNASAMPAS
jgi:hypothetical protein